MGDDKMDTSDAMAGPSSKQSAEEPMAQSSNKQLLEARKYDWNETIEPHVKIAVMGEKGCGKSSLILAASNQIFPHPDEIFVSRQHPLEVEVNGKVETCLVAEVDNIADGRSKIYSETDVVVLCFDEIQTLAEIEKKWVDELKVHIPQVPVFLVRVKKTKSGSDNLYSEVILEVEPFSGLIECCPHSKKNVRLVFQEAVKKAKGRELCEKK